MEILAPAGSAEDETVRGFRGKGFRGLGAYGTFQKVGALSGSFITRILV